MGNIVTRGIRGAITVARNTPEEILAATRELLEAIIKENDLDPEDIASAFFTTTADLDAEFPASAAREMGWKYVPLICATEINVPGRLDKCVRILVHVNTEKSQRELKHVYIGEAAKLRVDLLPQ
ncbi:MAG: Chorismate mutase AroH [Pelotomaculum sp. PtaU1.Bin035]|nr:MAG: Chorismate mutase AroH [Pelotomaculum sp. PtaU1.Bin035]